MNTSRRSVLRYGGSVVAGVALAGCSESGNNGNDENTDSSDTTSSGTADDESSLSGPTRGGEYPQDVYDAANSGAPEVGISEPASESWRVESSGIMRIHQGVLMLSNADGMTAYDVGSGEKLWQVEVGYDNHAAIDGTVYRGMRSDSGEVIAAYSIDDGSKIGELEIEGEAAYPLAVDESRVYAPINITGGGGTKLAVIDRDLSEVVWESSYPSSYNLYLSPAVKDGVVYNARLAEAAANAEREMIAYDAETGEQLWLSNPSGIEPGLSVGAGAVYANQTAIDAASGEERWTTELEPNGSVSPATVTDEAIVYTSSGTTADEVSVQAVDPDTGERRWRRAFEWDGISLPIIGDGMVYVAYEGGVYALSITDGSTEWNVEGLSLSAMKVLDGMVVGESKGNVVAYTP